MKKYLFLLLSLWCLSLSAQTPEYVYNFKQVITPGTNDKKNGVGKLTIYDDLTAELYIKAGTREYRKSIKILSYSFGMAGGFLYSSREKSNNNAPRIMISISGISAYYIENEDDVPLFGGQVSDTGGYPNESVYKKMKSDMDNCSGIFSSFHNPLNDILPFRFESPDVMRLKVDDASKGEYSGLVNYEGGSVGIILYLKSGQYPDKVGIEYDLEIKPMENETAEWISIINTHPNVLAIKLDPNYESHARAANLIFRVNGKVQGSIFVIQLAEGSRAPW